MDCLPDELTSVDHLYWKGTSVIDALACCHSADKPIYIMAVSRLVNLHSLHPLDSKFSTGLSLQVPVQLFMFP